MELEGLEIAELKMTCSRSPSQWEGRLSDNRAIYIRYRWGELEIHLSNMNGNIDEAIGLDPVFEMQVGNDLDGDITLVDVRRLTGLIGPKEIN